ncbi:MAG: translation elongation factor Ts [Planctomycetota bacterium]
MAEINAKDVMKLRNATGLAMMECKKALTEADGDPEKAEELLRKKLKGKMEKRSDRAAGEGRVTVKVAGDNSSAVIIELKAETDFTAKNDNFGETIDKLAELALAQPAGKVEPTPEMLEIVDNIKVTTGENISIGRIEKVDTAEGVVFGSYVHHDNKTAVLLIGQGDVNDETLRKVGMHVTSAVPRPLGVSEDEIPADMVEKEKAFRISQAVESGKPQEIAEKMVEGGMKKFFAEVALLEQKFVMDESQRIKDVVAPGTITQFYRWSVGEEA